jgi:S1/P1 Nuclease
MRKSFLKGLTVSFLIVSLVPPQSALAWGNTGHEAVAYIAWQRLKGRQDIKDKIWALLQQVPTRTSPTHKVVAGFKEWSQNLPSGLSPDEQQMYVFMRAATWPDSMKHVGFKDSDNPPPVPADGATNLGFNDAFSHGYWHFVDTALGAAATATSTLPAVPKDASCWIKKKDEPPALLPAVKKLPDAPVPDAITEIHDLSGYLASNESSSLKAYDMIWLEHLVGDIHQPLHASVRYVAGIGDQGGNCVAITISHLSSANRANFASSNPKADPPSELHAFWDDLPGVGTAMETAKAATYAGALSAADDKAAAISDPKVWAQESFDLAVKHAYASPIGPGFGSPNAYVITDPYFSTAADDAKARIALAGARLACLLTNALQEKTHSSQGSCPA